MAVLTENETDRVWYTPTIADCRWQYELGRRSVRYSYDCYSYSVGRWHVVTATVTIGEMVTALKYDQVPRLFNVTFM